MARVYVTRRLPPECMARLRALCDGDAPVIGELRVNDADRQATRDELVDGGKWADAVLSQLVDTVDAALLDEWCAPAAAAAAAAASARLRCVANFAVGFNNIDVDAATAHGVAVCNTPGVLTGTTADLTWALLMAAARRIPEADEYMRGGRYTCWAPELLLGVDVFEKTIGIIGFGRIGQEVARRARGFSMRILYFDSKACDDAARELGAERCATLDSLLEQSDFVTVHTVLSPATHHLLSDAQFERCRRSCVLVNAARGPIVDEKALVRALRERRIRAAALDVFECEPAFEPELAAMRDRVIMVPHIGSATIETRTRMGMLAIDNVCAVLAGKRDEAKCVNAAALDANAAK